MRLWKKSRCLRMALLVVVGVCLLVSLNRPPVPVPATSHEQNLRFLTYFPNCVKVQLPRYNPHIQSKVCQERKPWLLYVVHTGVEYAQRRQVVRSTWGSVTSYRDRSIAVVFLVGVSRNKSHNEALATEHAHYGDLVQGEFWDSYHNMTYKHLLALDWATRCSDSVQYIAKVDDDTLVNPFRLVEHLELSPLPPKSVLCRLLYGFPERKPEYKHFLSKEDFPLDTFPRYCCGFAYVIRPRDAAALVRAGVGAKFFWVDDVYVTGMLRLRAEITIENFRKGWGWGEMSQYDKTRRGPKTDSEMTRSYLFHLGENVPEHKYKQLWNSIMQSQTTPRTG